MPTIGEADVILYSQRIGEVRALHVFADSAVYPRLGVQVGVSLRDTASDVVGSKAISAYELRELTGELRLSENADAIAGVSWAGPHRYVRSSADGFETQIKCICDLDPFRLELIEKNRNGGIPRFYLQLWPTLVAGGLHLDADIRAFEIRVPREQWLEFLSRAGNHDYEIVEVHYGPVERDHFRRGLERAREARAKLAAGEYDEAVAACRKVLEAVGHEISPGDGDAALKALFTRVLGEKRGEHYAGIVSRVKQLAAVIHHDIGSPLTYSRAEAQFIVRTTEGLLSLASNILVAPGSTPAR